MLNESQQKPKPRRQQSTHKKKTGWNTRCPDRNRKQGRKRRKKNKKNPQQERKKEDSTQGEHLLSLGGSAKTRAHSSAAHTTVVKRPKKRYSYIESNHHTARMCPGSTQSRISKRCTTYDRQRTENVAIRLANGQKQASCCERSTQNTRPNQSTADV